MYVLGCVLYPMWSSTVVRRREEKQAVIPEHSAAQRIKAVTLQLISISLAFPKDPLVSLPAYLLAFACACPRASGRLPAFADTASSRIHRTIQHSQPQLSTFPQTREPVRLTARMLALGCGR